MNNQYLLDLDSKEERLSRQVDILTAKLDLYRKGMHASLGSLKKQNDELKHEIETLKRAISRGESIQYQGLL